MPEKFRFKKEPEIIIKIKMYLYGVDHAEIYLAMLAVFLPCFVLKVWSGRKAFSKMIFKRKYFQDIRSKHGLIIFFKFNEDTNVEQKIEQLKKCFRHAECITKRDFLVIPSDHNRKVLRKN